MHLSLISRLGHKHFRAVAAHELPKCMQLARTRNKIKSMSIWLQISCIHPPFFWNSCNHSEFWSLTLYNQLFRKCGLQLMVLQPNTTSSRTSTINLHILEPTSIYEYVHFILFTPTVNHSGHLSLGLPFLADDPLTFYHWWLHVCLSCLVVY